MNAERERHRTQMSGAKQEAEENAKMAQQIKELKEEGIVHDRHSRGCDNKICNGLEFTLIWKHFHPRKFVFELSRCSKRTALQTDGKSVATAKRRVAKKSR